MAGRDGSRGRGRNGGRGGGGGGRGGGGGAEATPPWGLVLQPPQGRGRGDAGDRRGGSNPGSRPGSRTPRQPEEEPARGAVRPSRFGDARTDATAHGGPLSAGAPSPGGAPRLGRRSEPQRPPWRPAPPPVPDGYAPAKAAPGRGGDALPVEAARTADARLATKGPASAKRAAPAPQPGNAGKRGLTAADRERQREDNRRRTLPPAAPPAVQLRVTPPTDSVDLTGTDDAADFPAAASSATFPALPARAPAESSKARPAAKPKASAWEKPLSVAHSILEMPALATISSAADKLQEDVGGGDAPTSAASSTDPALLTAGEAIRSSAEEVVTQATDLFKACSLDDVPLQRDRADAKVKGQIAEGAPPRGPQEMTIIPNNVPPAVDATDVIKALELRSSMLDRNSQEAASVLAATPPRPSGARPQSL